MDAADLVQPSVFKSCGRCRARKIKCDLQVPQCAACRKHEEPCDIVDCVAYPYAVVSALRDQVRDLQSRLDEAQKSSGGPSTLPAAPGRSNDSAWADEIRKAADEVGTLVIGGASRLFENQYVGSAAGSTFSRIFFKLLHLTPPSHSPADAARASLQEALMARSAGLPPRSIGRLLFHGYIARVHIWRPFLSLPFLRRIFRQIYQNPRQCNDYEKFLVFVVFALASDACADCKEYQALLDVNSPQEYFQTSLQFFSSFQDHSRDLGALHALLLLTTWALQTGTPRLQSDLWHLARYAMSVAIEMGLHRHNADWGFGADELEIRNRTWWCTYNLERQIALLTGRVLSIRDHAIHTLMPSPAKLDDLEGPEAQAAPLFHQKQVHILNCMVQLHRIGGRILESVYIARDRQGRALFVSIQEICTQFDDINRDLDAWKHDLDSLNIKSSREYCEMKIEYANMILLLNRPTPTFMIPSHQMIATCSKAVSSAVRQWTKIQSQFGVEALGRSSRTLHMILMVGLAALYCDWQIKNTPQRDFATAGPVLHNHGTDTAVCLDLMESCIQRMNDASMLKYRDLLRAVRLKVYGPGYVPRGPNTTQMALSTSSQPAAASPFTISDGPDLSNTQEPWLLSGNQGLESYVTEVMEFLDDDMAEMDNGLAAWYSSVMEEIYPDMPTSLPSGS